MYILKNFVLLTFSGFPQYCQTIIMVKGIVCVFYKRSQQNCPYPSTKKIIAPSRSDLSSHCDINNDCSTSLFSHNYLSHVSHLTTATKVDTDRNNDNDTQYFAFPRKHNQRNPKILETATTTTSIRPNVNDHQSKMSY